MNAARAVAVRLNKRRLWPSATYATCVAAAALGSVALTQTTDARTESVDLAVRRAWPQWPADKRLPVCADVGQLYNLDSVIGRGGFGLVHEGRDRQSQTPVAIKRVCKQNTSKDKFLQEVEILRAMGGHHNVVGLCEAFETTDAYVLVTELVEGEELFEHLVNKGVFSEQRARRLVHQIAQTLAYLHEHRVVHGDLKPENILLSLDASHMRLIDFGQSFREHVSAERSRCLGSGVATVAYAAPEVIKSANRSTSATAGSAIDMWGLGVVLYIVLSGYHPFDADNNASDKELAMRIASGSFDKDSAEWHDLAPEARDLIEKLLEVDPSQRLTAEDVLSHKWLEPVLSN